MYVQFSWLKTSEPRRTVLSLALIALLCHRHRTEFARSGPSRSRCIYGCEPVHCSCSSSHPYRVMPCGLYTESCLFSSSIGILTYFAECHSKSAATSTHWDIEFAANNPGQWLFHCHIPHHMTNNMSKSGGGMGQFFINSNITLQKGSFSLKESLPFCSI